ncbi:hypothetical protein Lesp02_12840 [Lentzea sp. NBRC 105346]|uniref:carboxyl transferase domain-containing protein n=1 Tax=Lentzea sp. NBRC 105346 TaxID=3032205 RepID=UPI0024A1DD63|nr:carboxyl transferase domain-containing protein [Lentzea sp. NBRC 105346]GLZ29094.1 hypothetical protein Lesp02_12840 [Lentzea sp. NBRC 105346]
MTAAVLDTLVHYVSDETSPADVVEAIDRAVASSTPVIGVWHTDLLAEMGPVYTAMARASGRVPQISVLAGASAPEAVALTDLVVSAGALSGLAHVMALDLSDALRRAGRLAALLARPGSASSVCGYSDLASLLPAGAHRAYDVGPLVRALLDPGTFEELHSFWAPNIVTGLGRLGGGAVGVIANNPLRSRGRLDPCGAEKAARLVRMCDTFGLPLLVLVDVPGSLPGVEESWASMLRQSTVLLRAFAQASVPRVALVTRKAYHGAYSTVNACSLGVTAVCAWPGAADPSVASVVSPEATRTELARLLSGPQWMVAL